jgi:hypothetical protein
VGVQPRRVCTRCGLEGLGPLPGAQSRSLAPRAACCVIHDDLRRILKKFRIRA